MALSKNDKVLVKIESMTNEGLGVARVDGYVLFVKDAVPGDVAEVIVTKVKKSFGYARLVDVVDASDDRVNALCKDARRCGGCTLQEMKYKAQLKFKRELVKNNLERLGSVSDYELEEIIGMDEPFYYRNKAQYPFGRDRDGNIIAGFYAGRTHNIIDIKRCMLGVEIDGRDLFSEIIDIIKKFMEEFGISPYSEKDGTGLIRHALIRVSRETSQVMVCIVSRKKKVLHTDELVKRLLEIPGMTDISINVNPNNTNVILGSETVSLYGPGYIEDSIGDVKFRISPMSFFQVNAYQTKKLYDKALEYANLSGKETVWDLYCGIGSISLFLARCAKKVIGVEIIPQAIDNANENAKQNGIHNAKFLCGAAEKVVPEYFKEHKEEPECHPDVIVVDPPRKGCDEKLLSTMAAMNPDRIVYVSCDSATLARDVKWLEENGYKLKKAAPCDMFAQTGHVECVCLLTHS